MGGLEGRSLVKRHLTVIEGTIARRLLVNFRVRPECVRPFLPAPFRPKLVQGWAMAGLCLIRLEGVRPKGFPAALGMASENAAHRIAAEWDEDNGPREGVFILRRETDSRVNLLLGGRVFPGVHHLARFDTWETERRLKIAITEADGRRLVRVAARLGEPWPVNSIFASLKEASAFFQRGSWGWSMDNGGSCEDMVLHIPSWRAEPLFVERVKSGFFDDRKRFPAGSLEFDSALLMRNLLHEWRVLPALAARREAA